MTRQFLARAWPRAWVTLRILALVGLLLLSLALTWRHVFATFDPGAPFDWGIFQQATERLDGASLYEWEYRGSYEYSYRYSPLFAYVLTPIIAMGLTLWRLLHFAVLALLPWRIAALTLLAWPFWEDVYNANVMTFAFVFGWLAIGGSRWATGAYLGLALLVPRPLMLPVAAWLLWRRPEWRLPAVGMTVAYVGLTLATGEADAFLGAVLRSDDMVTFARNFGPTRQLGLAWLAIGIPLAVWLTFKGRLGWASLAISPYILPYHFLMGLVETAPRAAQLRGAVRRPDDSVVHLIRRNLLRYVRETERRGLVRDA